MEAFKSQIRCIQLHREGTWDLQRIHARNPLYQDKKIPNNRDPLYGQTRNTLKGSP